MRNRIQEARKDYGITQKRLSELSGVPKRTIEDWEAQKMEPSAYKLYRVAKVLGCSMDDLIIEDKNLPE